MDLTGTKVFTLLTGQLSPKSVIELKLQRCLIPGCPERSYAKVSRPETRRRAPW